MPKENLFFWSAGIAGILSLMAFGSEKINAQQLPSTIQTDQSPIHRKMGEVASEPLFGTVTGIVTDDTGLPIPAVKIINKRTKTETQTDSEGNFTIAANINDVLVFSFLGFSNSETTVHGKTVKVQMEADHVMLGGIVVTGEPIRKSFFGRIFHSIGNWFQ